MESLDRLSPSTQPLAITPSMHNKDFALGLVLLLGVVVLWTSSNFITQDLFDAGYAKPFLVTYLNTSAFSLYLLPFTYRYLKERAKQLDRHRSTEYQPLSEADQGQDVEHLAVEQSTTPLIAPVKAEAVHSPLTTVETVRLALEFCFLWFIANWSVNASLDYTSVASATILSSMSGFFTLGVGRAFGVESLNSPKIAAVMISFGGTILVSTSDSQQPTESITSREYASQPLLGDLLALLSAVFYAFYVTLLKVRIQHESRIDMQLFFGFVGLFNILLCWPIGVILHFIGVEAFELPKTGRTILALLINMAITLSSDYIYVLAMLKTTPLVVTVGISLTIPLAVVGDMLLGRFVALQVIIGAVLVIGSFVLVGWGGRLEENESVAGRVEI
ncbi:hypothetical protein AX16_009513 [Volvariella volvacea WC 439]|nr:hypothetical protein AX16_009513 [Volvariella volvacea WC 439]